MKKLGLLLLAAPLLTGCGEPGVNVIGTVTNKYETCMYTTYIGSDTWFIIGENQYLCYYHYFELEYTVNGKTLTTEKSVSSTDYAQYEIGDSYEFTTYTY